jgi:hypothetical protein
MKRVKTSKVAIVILLLAAAGFAAEQSKTKVEPGKTIDSGSFGVFIKGQRMLTESFTVQSGDSGSIIKSKIKEAPGGPTTNQDSDLEITPKGELVRYQWSQSGTTNGSLTVLPNNDFLLEKITTGSGKPGEQPFLMPSTSVILDNNFFIHREVLAWRYLAADCKQESGSLKCQKGPVEFGVLVPQDQTSMRVRMELVGPDKAMIRGAEKDLLQLKLSGEGFEWTLWVDGHDQFKLVKVEIPSDNTEVVRD